MIDFIKSLPKPVLIASCAVIYILIGMLVSFVAGLFDDGSEDFIVIGALWIFVLPMAAVIGVLWIFDASFKLGAKISKPKVSDIPPIDDEWMTVDEIRDYYEEENDG
jgi:hypothetical protein